ncbi:MAG: SIS domain-containing protein [Anaerolineae bacterium]|nr:SIS domain-containing protein [Anaerolineae bacterium]
MRGQHTWSEIQSQPEVWEAALERASEAGRHAAQRWPLVDFSEALFVGCGSTHYLSLSAAALCHRLTGLRSRGLPSSEVFLFPEYSLPAPGASPLLVAVSRSGETTETLLALRAFRERFPGPALTVGNYPESALVRQCDAALVVPEGREESVAQTRSFTSMLLSLQVYLGLAAGNGTYVESLRALPGAARTVLERDSEPLQQLGGDGRFETIIFLGSGPFYGIACEGMLKMKEMSLSHSEAYHFLEFRHGPKSIVTQRTLIAALLSDGAREQELRVLQEMRQLGATVLLVADEVPDATDAYDVVAYLGSGLPEAARLPLCLLPLQLLAYGRALAKGLDPDRPAHLDSVVVL